MSTKKVLPILFAIMFLVMVGFGIIIPIIPYYTEYLGASVTGLGWLMSIYSITQFVFAPIWGKVSDKIGRKPVILIGIIGLALSFYLMAIAKTFAFMFIARTIGGILSAANMTTVMAYVADITTKENRAKGMGMIGAATGLGFVFGPAIGGVLSRTSIVLPFWVSGICATVTAIGVFFLLEESKVKQKRETKEHNLGSLKIVFGLNGLLLAIQLVATISLAGLETTFAYFVKEKIGMEPYELGFVFMIMGLCQAAVQGGLLGTLVKKFGEGKIIILGLVLSAIGFMSILFISNFLTAAIFVSILGVGNGFIRPCITAILTNKSIGTNGQISGLIASFDSLGRIIGPIVGSSLFAYSINLPYYLGVLLTVLGYFMFMVYKLRNQQKELESSN